MSAALELAAEPVDPRTRPCRYSALKQFSRSPLHYWQAMQDQHEETLSMRLGSGCHAITFGTPYVVWPQRRAGKAWEAFEAEHAGQLILTRSELAQADAMARSLTRHREAMAVLFGPGVQHERTLLWDWDGRAYRSTPDAFGPEHLVDLKCLRSAAPADVEWASARAQYHAQAALYRRALHQLGLSEVRQCFLVVVENKAPHPVTVLKFGAGALEQGDRLCVGWNEYRRACEDANEYPGYVQAVVDLDLPGDDGLVWPDEDNKEHEVQ